MRIVVALGGNALLRRGEPLTAQMQRENVKHAAAALAELVSAGHAIVITHGNGPQVGMLALQAGSAGASAFPLDVLGAESAGMIGYVIEQELGNVLPGETLATLLTQVKVDARDPAFETPSKPIGPTYDEAEAQRLAAERGWQVARDGKYWRRVVPSPRPIEICEAQVIRLLMGHGVIVVCTGGGGIPVVETEGGALVGIEAVIDKDLSSALLARQLKADMLLLLTDVDAVYVNYGRPDAHPVGSILASEISASDFPRGSMGPKVAAAVEFATLAGGVAGIGKLEDALGIVEGTRGTRLLPQRRQPAGGGLPDPAGGDKGEIGTAR